MTVVRTYDAGRAAGNGGGMRRVSWGAIFAGAVVAIALMIFFTLLGTGIGFSVIDPQFDSNPVEGLPTSAVVYLIITQLLSLAAGGFIAARLAGVPRAMTAMMHGATVWALATVFMAWASIMGAGAIFGAAGSMMSSAASTLASAGEAIIPDDISLPDFSELANDVSLSDLPEELQATLRANGVTDANLKSEVRNAFRDVVSPQEQEAALNAVRKTAANILRSPGNLTAELDALSNKLVGGPDAIISEEDRKQAIATLERRLGMTPEEVEQVVTTAERKVEAAVTEARQTIEELQAEAVQAAQEATDALATVALMLALASILGLAAACGGAYAGKPEDMIGDRFDDHV